MQYSGYGTVDAEYSVNMYYNQPGVSMSTPFNVTTSEVSIEDIMDNMNSFDMLIEHDIGSGKGIVISDMTPVDFSLSIVSKGTKTVTPAFRFSATDIKFPEIESQASEDVFGNTGIGDMRGAYHISDNTSAY
jgi:hypothetical protein